MIQHEAFVVEPWAVHETALDLGHLAQTESVFALANGHVGMRANLDEGEPFGLPGTYLAGFYETRPLPYAEDRYGDPEDGQTVVNVTNGKIIRLLVEDEPFDVRYGEMRKHERVLDLRAGVLRRMAESRRLGAWSALPRVGWSRSRGRSIAAILYEVEPLDDAVQLVVQSELVTRLSSVRWARSCSSRRPGCGARSVTLTPQGSFASMVSPGRTNTARSPTTTFIRT
jgi:alpha,alpha-trehalose phosphorylase